MTQNFQNISVTLPKQQWMKQHVFYSTAKNWNESKSFFQQSKTSGIKQMSWTTQLTRLKPNFAHDKNLIDLQERLNEKNELLIKQSKSKNYYLKQEISVLLQEILNYLDTILQNFKYNQQLKAYRNKLEKTIDKVQWKRKSQANWFQFFGFSPKIQAKNCPQPQKIPKIQLEEQKVSKNTNQFQEDLRSQISTLKQENKRLIQSVNILSLEIQSKQKQVFSLKQKYSKAKSKKETFKMQLIELQKQYQIINNKNQAKNGVQNGQQLNQFTKSNKKSKHLHTYSLDRNFNSRNLHSNLTNEGNLHVIEDSQNLFTLSDTPFIGDKRKQIPVSLQYLQVRKRILSTDRNPSEKQNFKKKNIDENQKSHNDSQINVQKKHSQYSDYKYKKNNKNNAQEPSLNYEHNNDDLQQMRYLLLSQSLAIEKLLQKI